MQRTDGSAPSEDFYERFTTAFASRVRELTLETIRTHTLTDLGPLISEAQRDKVTSYAANALAENGVTSLVWIR